VYRNLLRVERERLRASENASIQSFERSFLLNDGEVGLARANTGRDTVHVLRPYMPDTVARPRCPPETPVFVFLGRLNVPHNDSAITSFVRDWAAAVEAELPTAVIRIIGRGASASLQRLATINPRLIELTGYVDDLDALFATTTAMLAPLRVGTGVKVKVLEALARGLPVVGTELAFSGIPARRDGSSGCLIDDDFSNWPKLLRRVSDHAENEQLSSAARAFYVATYGRDVVAQEYETFFSLPPAVTEGEVVRVTAE
jgi:glycosyltransferase involved in cell wall biosynthesis